MPPTHRPTPAIPSVVEFLLWPWWLPILLFWALVLGTAYLVWSLG
jgi:hypothetical protein